MHVLKNDLLVGESPRWHDGRLWLANWGTHDVLAIDADGGAKVMARSPVTIPFCIDWLPDGRLLIVAGRENRVVLADGSTYADLAAISEKGFNEIVVDGRGNAFVNGGGFDLMAGETPQPGGVAVVTPDGSVRQVADGIMFPNGMALTAGDETLVVADSYARRLLAFDVAADGELSNRRVWAELGDGVPDGICIDAEGAVWYADVPNRRCVRVREGGEVLDTVQLDRGCFACALGGDDGRTLFVVAARWHGPERMFDGPPSGQVVAVPLA